MKFICDLKPTGRPRRKRTPHKSVFRSWEELLLHLVQEHRLTVYRYLSRKGKEYRQLRHAAIKERNTRQLH